MVLKRAMTNLPLQACLPHQLHMHSPLKVARDKNIIPHTKTTSPVVWLGSLVVSMSDPMTARLGVRSLTTALSSNNLGQVVHTPQPIGAMPQFGGPAD